jgi:hypothetical protein
LGVVGGVFVCFFFVPFADIVRTILRVAATLCVRSSHSPSRYSHGLHALVLVCVPADCQGGLGGVTFVAPCAVYCSTQFSAVCSLLLDAVLCHTACVSHRSPVDLCHLSAEWLLPNRFGAMRSTWWARLIITLVTDTTSRLFLWGRSRLVCPLSCSMQRSVT